MSIETALVVSLDDAPIFWHTPKSRSAVHLPDSRTLWDVIWEHRQNLKGIAHTHPGSGVPHPSMEDITTFDAIEKAIGRTLSWWILTSNQVSLFVRGTTPLEYRGQALDVDPGWAGILREFSHY